MYSNKSECLVYGMVSVWYSDSFKLLKPIPSLLQVFVDLIRGVTHAQGSLQRALRIARGVRPPRRGQYQGNLTGADFRSSVPTSNVRSHRVRVIDRSIDTLRTYLILTLTRSPVNGSTMTSWIIYLIRNDWLCPCDYCVNPSRCYP